MTYARVSAMKLKELVQRDQEPVVVEHEQLAMNNGQTRETVAEEGQGGQTDLSDDIFSDSAASSDDLDVTAARVQEQREVGAAATRIQAAQRGRLVRTQLAGETAAAVRIQATHRGKLSRGEFAQQRNAAIRIHHKSIHHVAIAESF